MPLILSAVFWHHFLSKISFLSYPSLFSFLLPFPSVSPAQQNSETWLLPHNVATRHSWRKSYLWIISPKTSCFQPLIGLQYCLAALCVFLIIRHLPLLADDVAFCFIEAFEPTRQELFQLSLISVFFFPHLHQSFLYPFLEFCPHLSSRWGVLCHYPLPWLHVSLPSLLVLCAQQVNPSLSGYCLVFPTALCL